MQSRSRVTWAKMLLQMLLVMLMLMLGSDSVVGRRRDKRGGNRCSEDTLVQYQLTFHGFWAKTAFPKMYPRYRPKAQWSKLVGRSHGAGYELWTLGRAASPAVQQFAEEGRTALLDVEAQGYNDTFDLFSAAPVKGGVGRTSTRVLLDGAHSRVSLMVKLIPSPDWFVGISSYELCRHGRWKKRLAVNLRPLDAGTDKGLTYTSPNWPAVPPEGVFEIRTDFPRHPASSFHYPKVKTLPRIARVSFQRVVQYRKRGAKPVPKESPPNVVVSRQRHEVEEDQLSLLTPALVPVLPDPRSRPATPLGRPLQKDQSPTPQAERILAHLAAVHARRTPAPSPVSLKAPRPTAPPRHDVTPAPLRLVQPAPDPSLSNSRSELTADFSEEDAYLPGQRGQGGKDHGQVSTRLPDRRRTPTLTAEDMESGETGARSVRPQLTLDPSRHPQPNAPHPAEPTLSSKGQGIARLEGGVAYRLPSGPRLKDQRPLQELDVDAREDGVRLVKLQTSERESRKEATGVHLESQPFPRDGSEDESYLDHRREGSSRKDVPVASSSRSPGLERRAEAPLRQSSVQTEAEDDEDEDEEERRKARAWSAYADTSARDPSRSGRVIPTRSVQSYAMDVEGPGKEESVQTDVTSEEETLRTVVTHRLPPSARYASTRLSEAEKNPDAADLTTEEERQPELDPHIFNGEVEPEWDVSNLNRRQSVESQRSSEAVQHEVPVAPSPRLGGPRHRPPRDPLSPEPTEPPSTSQRDHWQPLVGGVAFEVAARPSSEGHDLSQHERAEQHVLSDSEEVPALKQSDRRQLDDDSSQDCLVTGWGEWSSCSKTCGFGVRHRERHVLQHPKHGGQPCPRLRTETVCGSMRNCRWNYFSRFFNKRQKHRRRRRRHHDN